MIKEKDQSSIDDITGLYLSIPDDPYTSHPFPFNIRSLGKYLKDTGKTMKDLTVCEFDMFRVKPYEETI